MLTEAMKFGLLPLAAPSFAYHSFALEFDAKKCREFTGTVTHWDGDTFVVESVAFDDRTYIMPNGWFHSDALKVTERYTRPSMNYLLVQITVDDPKVLTKPWKSANRRWTLGNGEVYEFYCDNNKDVEELNKLKEVENKAK